jgi:hypothetical protein
MSRLAILPARAPAAAARLTKPPKVSDQFYSLPEWRAWVRDLLAIRGWRCEVAFVSSTGIRRPWTIFLHARDIGNKPGTAPA